MPIRAGQNPLGPVPFWLTPLILLACSHIAFLSMYVTHAPQLALAGAHVNTRYGL